MSNDNFANASPAPSQNNKQPEGTRRDFLILSGVAMGGVGAAITAWPLVNTLNPAADALALATTEVNVSSLQAGQAITVTWRGKPVFIRRRTQEEISAAAEVDMSTLRDPQTDAERTAASKFDGKEMPEWLVVIGVCTHFGCIPLGQKPTDNRGEYNGWFCPCHGSAYDTAGRIRKGPAPTNLTIPPYTFTSATNIKIG